MIPLKRIPVLLAGFCCALLAAGCAPEENPPESLRDAEERFIEICRDEFGYALATRAMPNSFWIYMPVEEMFDFKASPKLPPGFAEPKRNFSVEFLDGWFKDGRFVIEHDIITATKPPKDHGYSTAYAESYSRIQNNILSALSRSFFEMPGGDGNVPGNRTDNMTGNAGAAAPDFIVLTVADIKRGIETQSIFYLGDFRRYMSQTLPYDEYAKRHISETRGDRDIVGDTRGRHVQFRDITWPEFLAQQILNRVRFKYQRSDFAPKGSLEDEILQSIQETVSTYGFSEFDGITLIDLRRETRLEFGKPDLKRFDSNAEPAGGITLPGRLRGFSLSFPES